MKLKIYTITTLFILLSATFSQSIYAQTTKKQVKVLTQEESDKREVEKFVDKFMLTFEQKKDIRLIPKRFFTKDFKANFLNYYRKIFFVGMKEDEAKVFNQLSDDDLYQNFILGINFSQLIIMIQDGNCCEGISALFPTKVLKQFNKQEARAAQLFANSDGSENKRIKNLKQFYDSIIVLKMTNNAQQKYLENRSSNWKKTYQKNIAKTRKHFKSYRSFFCSHDNDECDNQPKETKMFYIAAFPHILKIQKNKADYKISNIFLYTN